MKNILKLMEMMSKLDKSFRLTEAKRSSYNTDLLNDIKVMMGNNTELYEKDAKLLAQQYNTDVEEVYDTVDYINQLRNQDIEKAKDESEPKDFYKFSEKKPKRGQVATLTYFSSLDRYLAKPKNNPMVGRFIKITKYRFNWEQTYEDAIKAWDPNYVIQQRKGKFDKVEGYEKFLELNSRGQESVRILPKSSRYMIIVLDENGDVQDTVFSYDVLKEKYGEFFKPSFFNGKRKEPVLNSEGVPKPAFRPLVLTSTYNIKGGGENWINPNLDSKYKPYVDYVAKVPSP